MVQLRHEKMKSTATDAPSARAGRRAGIARLLTAIGYPVRAPEGALAFTLLIDGGEVGVSDEGGALRLTCRLTDDESLLPRLAEYATGRMLREDAILACDASGAFIWSELDGGADAMELQRRFEIFADSCDWWRTRVDALRGGESAAKSGDELMMIRP